MGCRILNGRSIFGWEGEVDPAQISVIPNLIPVRLGYGLDYAGQAGGGFY